jgi:hypothetical protein
MHMNMDSDLLSSDTFCGNFCVLRYPNPPPPLSSPLSANEYTFVCYTVGWEINA